MKKSSAHHLLAFRRFLPDLTDLAFFAGDFDPPNGRKRFAIESPVVGFLGVPIGIDFRDRDIGTGSAAVRAGPRFAQEPARPVPGPEASANPPSVSKVQERICS